MEALRRKSRASPDLKLTGHITGSRGNQASALVSAILVFTLPPQTAFL